MASLRLFADERRPSPRRNSSYYDTDLGEREVVEGRTLAVLASKLREAAARDRPAIIHLMTTCLPELVGDDPRPVMKRLEREFGVKVVWTSKTRDPGVSFNDVLSGIVAGIRFAKKRGPGTVILAGAPDDAAHREMTRLLGTVGLKVAGSMFPDLDSRKMRGGRKAGALVWVSPVGWEKISDAHFIRNGLKVVRFHPPYGIRGTVEWLGRVCSVLGRDPSLAACAAAPHSRALAALRRECRERTVALIGDQADLSAMVQRGQPMGFSVAAVLSEMGFRVRCLVLDPDGKAQWWGAGGGGTATAPGDAGSGSVEFLRFSTSAELDRLLAGGVDLAFTHFNHDPRLAARGVAGFCEEAFEVGVEGFLASGRRLLRRCRTRPFPRHRRFLAA
ncbi:MAG: hypothetical protein HZB91_08880 [Elusimicrobia bacterium]|nr:hypothetical protein [Elusimicrobiota bacterium]